MGNCGAIKANGSVVNKLTIKGVPGVPVSLSWVKFVGAFSQSEVIATVNSKIDGPFNFTSNIDTGYFSKGYFLSLSIGKSNDYIILGYSGFIEIEPIGLTKMLFRQNNLKFTGKQILQLSYTAR
jgi:hypothetical protein